MSQEDIIYKTDKIIILRDEECITEDFDDNVLLVWIDTDDKGNNVIKTKNAKGKSVLARGEKFKNFKDLFKSILQKLKDSTLAELTDVMESEEPISDDTDKTTYELAHKIHNELVDIFHLSSEERSEKLTILALLLFAKKDRIEVNNLHEYAKNLDKQSLDYNDQFEGKNLSELYSDLLDYSGDFKVLYDEVFKYGEKREFKNSEFTPDYTSEFLSSVLKILLKRDSVNPNDLVIYEPCGGLCSLINGFLKGIPKKINMTLISTESVAEIAILSDAVNNLNGTRRFEIIHDVFDENTADSFDKAITITMLNPPFSKTTKGATGELQQATPVLKFIRDAAMAGKYSFSIFPENILTKSTDTSRVYLKELVQNCEIPIILRLGDSVFHNGSETVGTGEIVALYTIKRDEPVETDSFTSRVYNLDIDSCAKIQIRKGRFLTESGKEKIAEILDEITNDLITHENEDYSEEIEFNIDGVRNWFKSDVSPSDIIRKSLNLPDNLSDIQVLKYKLCSDKMIEQIESRTNVSYDDLSKGIDFDFTHVWNLDETKFVKIRLMDYFEKINGPSRTLNEFSVENGEFNFVSRTNKNNGVCHKCNEADYEASKENPLYTLSANGSAGYLFKQIAPFSKICHVFVLQRIQKLPFEKFNLDLISNQLNALHFKYSAAITEKELDDIEVLIYNSKV